MTGNISRKASGSREWRALICLLFVGASHLRAVGIILCNSSWASCGESLSPQRTHKDSHGVLCHSPSAFLDVSGSY